MENKIWTVKTAKAYDTVIMGLKLDGGLGKMNEADKSMNGLPTCSTKTSILTPCPTSLEQCNQTPNFLFGD